MLRVIGQQRTQAGEVVDPHCAAVNEQRRRAGVGAEGEPMRAEGGYIDVDKRMYRVMTITVGVVLNDCFEQAV